MKVLNNIIRVLQSTKPQRYIAQIFPFAAPVLGRFHSQSWSAFVNEKSSTCSQAEARYSSCVILLIV